jgi:hypothetical protein
MNAPDRKTSLVFHYRLRLGTGHRNACTQPVPAVLQENGFLQWHHIPAKWARTPGECDPVEWKSWGEENADLTRQLAAAFYMQHRNESGGPAKP